MKRLFSFLLVIISLSAFAQSDAADYGTASVAKKDTVLKTDSVAVPIPVFEKRDTVAAEYLVETKLHFVKQVSGFVVLRGFGIADPATGKLKWFDRPSMQPIGLDARKKPRGRIIQLLN